MTLEGHQVDRLFVERHARDRQHLGGEALADEGGGEHRVVGCVRLNRESVDRALPELAQALVVEGGELDVLEVGDRHRGAVGPGHVAGPRREEVRIVHDGLVDVDVRSVVAGEEGIDAQGRQGPARVVGEAHLVAGGRGQGQGAVDRSCRGHVGNAHHHVDLVDQVIERVGIAVDVDLVGRPDARVLVRDVEEEAAVIDVKGQSGGAHIESDGRVVDAVRAADRFEVGPPLPLGVEAVDLEDELGGELVEGVDRRLDRLLPLLDHGANRARAHGEIGAVGGHVDRHLELAHHRLGLELHPARLAAQPNRNRAHEDVDAAVGLLDDAEVEELSELVDENVPPIPQRVGLPGARLGQRDLAVDQGDLVENVVDLGDGGAQRPVDLVPDHAVVAAEPGDPAGQVAALLDDQRAHRVVLGVVGQLGKVVEEDAQLAGQVVVGQLVLERLDGGEEPLVDDRPLLIAQGVAQARLERRVDLPANGLQLHALADPLPAADGLAGQGRQMHRPAVVALGGGVGHVVAGHLHGRLAGQDRRSTDLQCPVETHVRLRFNERGAAARARPRNQVSRSTLKCVCAPAARRPRLPYTRARLNADCTVCMMPAR